MINYYTNNNFNRLHIYNYRPYDSETLDCFIKTYHHKRQGYRLSQKNPPGITAKRTFFLYNPIYLKSIYPMKLLLYFL